MCSNKIPVLHQRIQLVTEHHETRLHQAQLAQQREEDLGDLVHLTELRSDKFKYLHSMMSELYSSAVDLAFRGFLALEVVVSLSRHWDELILEELGNCDLRTSLLVLEEHFDLLETSFSLQADHFELLLVTLIALCDELIQGAGRTPPPPLSVMSTWADRLHGFCLTFWIFSKF